MEVSGQIHDLAKVITERCLTVPSDEENWWTKETV
jgi:hypothetical protein